MPAKKFVIVDARTDPEVAIVHSAAYATALFVPYAPMPSQVEALIWKYDLPDDDRMIIAMSVVEFFGQPSHAPFPEYVVRYKAETSRTNKRPSWHERGFFNIDDAHQLTVDEGVFGSKDCTIRERETTDVYAKVSVFSLVKRHERKSERVFGIFQSVGGQWMGWVHDERDTYRGIYCPTDTRVVWINDCFYRTGWRVECSPK